MRFLLYLLCLFSFSVLCRAVEDELIFDLTNATFDGFIEGEDMVIVEFYASWCVYCYELEPIFLEIAKNLKPHGIKMAKVNIEEEEPLKIRFSIQQLPGVLIFRNGIMYKYKGPLSVSGTEEITKYFLKEKEKDYLGENNIFELTNDNFNDITSSAAIILVNFYVEQCLKCKKLNPIFTTAARRLSRHTPPILFGKMDVPPNLDTAKQFGISNYPLLLMFRYGKRYNYTGEETEDGIVSYMKRQAGPASIYLEDVAAVHKFMDSPEEAVAVGFFTSETGASVVDTFIESGNEVRLDLLLGHTTDGNVHTQLKFEPNSVVVFHPKRLVSKYETRYSVIPDIEGETSESLGKMILEASKPLVGQVTLKNFGTAYTHRPLLVAYYDVNWDRENVLNTKYWHSLIADVASKYKATSLEFAIGQEEEFSQDLHALGLEDWGEDVAVGLFAPGPKKYRMTEELTKYSLSEFVDDFFSDSLTPYYMSEPPPKKGVGPVRTIVGSSFSKIVYDSSKNVVVMVCIPSISACHEAAEWFPKVASQYKYKDLMFGVVNVELNDIPLTTLKFDDLPTFLFSPKGSEGEEDLIKIDPLPEDNHDLTRWLRENQNIRIPKKEL